MNGYFELIFSASCQWKDSVLQFLTYTNPILSFTSSSTTLNPIICTERFKSNPLLSSCNALISSLRQSATHRYIVFIRRTTVSLSAFDPEMWTMWFSPDKKSNQAFVFVFWVWMRNRKQCLCSFSISVYLFFLIKPYSYTVYLGSAYEAPECLILNKWHEEVV